eukprot:SAG11_NODE_239_length_11783_cov_52.724923_11_plen_432_part_00
MEGHATGHLNVPNFSVTSCPGLPPSGDKHDYVSAAVYWWPCARTPGTSPCDVSECLHKPCNCTSVDICGKTNPTCDARTGSPWVSCDGHENLKEIAQGGLPQLQGMSRAAAALAAGFYWTRNGTFAVRTAELIEASFLAPSTKMNPNFEYGQAFPGVNDGSGSGLIEIDMALIDVLEAINLLSRPAPCSGCEASTAWTAAMDSAMMDWLRQWSAWLRSSPFSTWACNYRNNHNAACRASWLAVAAWLSDETLANELIAGVKERQWTNTTNSSLPYQQLGGADCPGCDGACAGSCSQAPIGGQIWRDGKLPDEVGRVNSVGYTVAELRNLFTLGQLSRHPVVGDDLFAYVSANGSSIRAAPECLLPYALGKKSWARHTETTRFEVYPQLRQAAAVFGNRSYSQWARRIAATGCESSSGGCAGDASVLWWPED